MDILVCFNGGGGMIIANGTKDKTNINLVLTFPSIMHSQSYNVYMMDPGFS